MHTTHCYGDTTYHVESDPMRGLLRVSHSSGALIATLNTRALILLELAPQGLKALDADHTRALHYAAFLLTVCGEAPEMPGPPTCPEEVTPAAVRSTMLEACPA